MLNKWQKEGMDNSNRSLTSGMNRAMGHRQLFRNLDIWKVGYKKPEIKSHFLLLLENEENVHEIGHIKVDNSEVY